MTIGRKIKEIRESMGLSQTQVAYMSHMSRQQLNAIESGGGYPLISTLIRLSNAMGCPLRDILNEPLGLDLPTPQKLDDIDYPCANAKGCMFFKKKE